MILFWCVPGGEILAAGRGRIRHRRTQFTVDDFSDFVGEQPVVLSI